jgi:PadR family transcriptional regulator PadR
MKRHTWATRLVLLELLHQPDRRYGLEIAKALGIQGGTLYPALARLEAAGFLTSGWEDDDDASANGRPPRRYYRLTAEGAQEAEAVRAEIPSTFRLLGEGAGA